MILVFVVVVKNIKNVIFYDNKKYIEKLSILVNNLFILWIVKFYFIIDYLTN